PDPAVCAAIGGSLRPVKFSVDEKGVPQDIQIGPQAGGGKDQPQLDAVRKWRFKPARSNGKPTSATASFTFECGPDEQALDAPPQRMGNGVTAPTMLSNVE